MKNCLYLFLILLFVTNCGKRQNKNFTNKGIEESGVEQKENYTILIEGDNQILKLNEEGKVRVKIRASNNFHINKDYPTKFVLLEVKGGGEIIGGEVLDRSHAEIPSEELLIFTIPFKVNKEGEVEFLGELKFSLCSETSCIMPKEKIKWKAKGEK